MIDIKKLLTKILDNGIFKDSNGDVDLSGSMTVGGHAGPIGDRQERNTSTTKATGTTWTSVSTSTVYANITAGTWYIQATAIYASNATNVRALRLYNNSTSAAFTRSEDVRPAVSGTDTRLHASVTVSASGNNTIVLQTYQNSGSTLNVEYYIEAIRIA